MKTTINYCREISHDTRRDVLILLFRAIIVAKDHVEMIPRQRQQRLEGEHFTYF